MRRSILRRTLALTPLPIEIIFCYCPTCFASGVRLGYIRCCGASVHILTSLLPKWGALGCLQTYGAIFTYAPYRSLSWNDLVAAILVHDCVLYNFALSFLYICSILAFATHPSSGQNFSPSAFCYPGRRGVQWNAVGSQAAALKIPAPLHRGKSFTAPCSLVGGTYQATYNAFSPQPTKA